MAWTDIETYNVNELATTTSLNTLQANINYLNSPNVQTYQHPGTGGDYTVTGSLGADLDTANYSLTLTTHGGLVMAAFYCNVKIGTTGSSIRMSIIRLDTVSHVGRNLFYNYDVETQSTATDGEPRGWLKPFPDLPAGTHTFRVIWGINPTSDTGTLFVVRKPRFTVWEW